MIARYIHEQRLRLDDEVSSRTVATIYTKDVSDPTQTDYLFRTDISPNSFPEKEKDYTKSKPEHEDNHDHALPLQMAKEDKIGRQLSFKIWAALLTLYV